MVLTIVGELARVGLSILSAALPLDIAEHLHHIAGMDALLDTAAATNKDRNIKLDVSLGATNFILAMLV